MADKGKDKDTENTGDAKAASSGDAREAKGKPGMMMILLIAAIVLGLGGLGVGGYALISSMQAAKAETPAEEGDVEPDVEVTGTDIYLETPIEGIVNLVPSETNSFTYLKYSFSVEVDSTQTLTAIEEKLPRLVAKVATVMSNRVWDEITVESGRNQLADEVKAAINTELGEGEVLEVLFITFVAQ